MNDHAILRMHAVCDETGLGRSSQWNHINLGLMTKPIRISANAVGIPAGEVRQINLARIAGATDDEIRALVVRLHEERKQRREAVPS